MNSFEESKNASNIVVDSIEEISFNAPGQHAPRILFANDDPFLLFTYSEQLKQDFLIEQAENGMQALQMVSSKPTNYYDVIVLDINMPIMDGFEACFRIHDYLILNQSLKLNPDDVARQFSLS